MLTTPDVWNDIAKIADKHFKADYSTGNLPDFSNVDFNKQEKINSRKYMEVIERLIRGCDINGNFDEKLAELNDYTKKYIDDSFPLMLPQTMTNILQGYQMNQFCNLINPPVQAFVLYVELIRQAYFYIQEKYIKRNKEKFEIAFIHVFLEYSLELLTGINSLLLDNNQNSVISVYRTFYENYIVFAYLQNHPELRNAFLDHANMDYYQLKIENLKLDNNQDAIKEFQTYIDELINKYGKDFKNDYGWALPLSKENNKLKLMFEESDLGSVFNYYYKLACKFTHATSFSLTVRPPFKDIIGFLYAISDIIIKEFKELFRYIPFKNKKENILLSQWINIATTNLNKAIKDFI